MRILGIDPGLATVGFSVVDTDKTKMKLVPCGVILLTAYRAGVGVFEYTPLQVKQAVVGYGRAEKNQVIEMVKRILSLPSAPKPDDAADAVALAICHARSSTSLLSRKEDEGLCSTI